MAEDERAYQRQRRAYKALYPAAKLLMKWNSSLEHTQ